MSLPPCPYCGDTLNGVYSKVQMRGAAEVYYNENGEYSEMSTDNLYHVGRGIIRCGMCTKIRRDLKIDRNKVVPV